MKRRSLILIVVASLAMTGIAASPALAALESIHGYAYVADVNVTLTGQAAVVDMTPPAGPITTPAGSDSNGGLSTCIPSADCSILSTGDRGAFTGGEIGEAGAVHSSASAAAVSALGGLVTGAFVTAECAIDAQGAATGSVALTDVSLNGSSVASSPAAGTVLELRDSGGQPAGHVVLNERSFDAATNTLTVNAIHIVLDAGGSLGSGHVVIGHVECGGTPAGADTTPPTTTAPSIQVIASAGRVRLVNISWSAQDTGGSGIAKYRLQLRVNGGRWSGIGSTSSSSLDRYFQAGARTYQLRVSAIDKAGNASAWAEGTPFTFPVVTAAKAKPTGRG